ncbi:pentapeptide repeat-containing protein [Curtobacterium sp. 179-B 9B NHS]|uniref:pentapeptide repeat-containing protein n=1 Tax=Curtobacterium sp. 179-B 9B NHS TaxID=3374293 RepID=UPI00387A7BC4
MSDDTTDDRTAADRTAADRTTAARTAADQTTPERVAGTGAAGAATPWYRRRRWSVGTAVLVLALVSVGYEYVSTGPAPTTIRECTIVRGASVSSHAECAGQDLAGADLSGLDLRLADLHGADLRGADLSSTILYGADLTGTDLRGTDLSQSDLTQADLTGASLDGTDFTDAGISGMVVEGTVLAASQYSRWVDDDEPVRVTLEAGTQPGITENSCQDFQGLYYPGQNVVQCRLSTDAQYDGTLSYGRIVEVKRQPIVSVPSEVRLQVGRRASVQLRAESPFPSVFTSFSGSLPPGMRWDADTQQIVGTPTERAIGTRTIEFVADNGRQVRTSITFTVTE